MLNSITQSTTYSQTFDRYGWPINPDSGQAYTADELAADPSLPLPQDPRAKQFVERQRARVQGKEIPPTKKTKKTKRAKARRRQLTASAGLANLSLRRSGAEKQAEVRGRAMGEQVKRVNSDSDPPFKRVIFLQSGRRFTILEVE